MYFFFLTSHVCLWLCVCICMYDCVVVCGGVGGGSLDLGRVRSSGLHYSAVLGAIIETGDQLPTRNVIWTS